MSRTGSRASTSVRASGTVQRHQEDAVLRPLQWPIIKRMLSYLNGHWWMYALGIFCIVCTSVIDLLPALLVKMGIDHVTGAMEGRQSHEAAYHGLMLTGGLYLLSVIGHYISHAGQDWLLRTSGELSLRCMRRDVFRKIQSLDMAQFDRTPIGRLITRGHSDIQVIGRVLIFTFSQAVNVVVTLVGAYYFMLMLDRRLFIVVLVASPFLYMASSMFRRRARPAWRRVRRDISRLTANVAEMVSGVRVIQAFTREDENLDRFDDVNMVFWRSNMRVARYQGTYLMIVEAICVLCLAGLLAWGGWMMTTANEAAAAAGTESVFKAGTLFAFFMLAMRVFEPLRRLAPIYSQILHAMASSERVFALLDVKPKLSDKPDAVPLPRVKGHVRFEHVDFEYVRDTPVLKDIDFEVPAGETVALIGHTGCGKTTIVNLVNRFYDVTQGRITVDGHDLRNVTQKSLHDQTGLILQENFLFDGTVMENLKYAKPDATDEQIINTCTQLGCHEIFDRLPQGYQSQVGERGENLSAGQRQLVSIARAMVADPRLLMLDEATSSVDTQTELAIQYAIERIMERRTCFIVAHRLSTIRNADQILVIDQGRIIERGTHEALVAAGGAYAVLHEQFMKVELDGIGE